MLDTVAGTDGVAAATGALSLTNSTFSGELPSGGFGGQDGAEGGEAPAEGQAPPQGGGGGAFGIDSFTVLGIDPSATEVGPLASAEIGEGRGLDADDSGALVALVDSTYAASEDIAVGDTLTSRAPTSRSSASSPRRRMPQTPRRTSTSRSTPRRSWPAWRT